MTRHLRIAAMSAVGTVACCLLVALIAEARDAQHRARARRSDGWPLWLETDPAPTREEQKQ